MKMEKRLKRLNWDDVTWLTVEHKVNAISITVTFHMVNGEKLVQPVITKEDDRLLTQAICEHLFERDSAGFDHTSVWVEYSRYPDG